MSNVKSALERGALHIHAPASVLPHAFWGASKATLIRFLNALPDSHEDIDPVTLRRLPVPY